MPPTWIFQCGRCHLVCGSCKPKTKECPECNEAIQGRAEEMGKMKKVAEVKQSNGQSEGRRSRGGKVVTARAREQKDP